MLGPVVAATSAVVQCLLQVCRSVGPGMLVRALGLALGGLAQGMEVVMRVMLATVVSPLALGRVCGMKGLCLRCSHMDSTLVEPGSHSLAHRGTLAGHRYLAGSDMVLADCMMFVAGRRLLVGGRRRLVAGCRLLVYHCIRSGGRASCMLYLDLVTVDHTAVAGMGAAAAAERIQHLHHILEISSAQASLGDIGLADRMADRTGPGCCKAQSRLHKNCFVGSHSHLAATLGTCPDQETAVPPVLLPRLRPQWIHLSRCRCDPACPTRHLPSSLAWAVPRLVHVHPGPLSRLAWQEGRLH